MLQRDAPAIADMALKVSAVANANILGFFLLNVKIKLTKIK